jgi:hypothetical protein
MTIRDTTDVGQIFFIGDFLFLVDWTLRPIVAGGYENLLNLTLRKAAA